MNLEEKESIKAFTKDNEPINLKYKFSLPELLKSPSKDDHYYFEKDQPFDSPKGKQAPRISSYEASEDRKYNKYFSSSKDSKKSNIPSDEKKENWAKVLQPGVIEKFGINITSHKKTTEEVEVNKDEKLKENEQLKSQIYKVNINEKEVNNIKNTIEDLEEFKQYYDELEEKEDLESMNEPKEEKNKLKDDSTNSDKQVELKGGNTTDQLGNLKGSQQDIDDIMHTGVEESEDIRDWIDKEQDHKLVIPATSFEEIKKGIQGLGDDKFRQRLTQEDVKKLHEARINNDNEFEDTKREVPSKLFHQEEPGIFDEHENLEKDEDNSFDRKIEDDLKSNDLQESQGEEKQKNISEKEEQIRGFTLKKEDKNSKNMEKVENSITEDENRPDNMFFNQQIDPEDEENFKNKIEGRIFEEDTTGKFGMEENKDFSKKSEQIKDNFKMKEKIMVIKNTVKENNAEAILIRKINNTEDNSITKSPNKNFREQNPEQYKQTDGNYTNKNFSNIKFEEKISKIEDANPESHPEYKFRDGISQTLSNSKGNINRRSNCTMQDDR